MHLQKSVTIIFGIAAALILAACSPKPPDDQMLMFMISEQGLAPYQNRIIITPEQIRFDDGEGSKSYTLYDRKHHIARTIDPDQKTILEMHLKTVKAEPPFALSYSVKDLGEMADAPKIMGKLPRRYQEYVNDKLCFDVISIDGLMPQAVQALAEFQQLLASDSAETVNNLPADMQDPCSLAMSTFAPTHYLQHGFPIHQWHPGYSRMLVDYKEHYQADPKLFEIPNGYFSYSVQQVRDGLVDLDNRKIRTPVTEAKPQSAN